MKTLFFIGWMVLVWVVGAGVPTMQGRLNPPPPESTLSHFEAKIISAKNGFWNLEVVTKSGIREKLRFPTPISLLGGQKYYNLSDEEINHLHGCDAEIYGISYKYTAFDDFRVWRVDCKSQPISYRRLSREYLSMSKDQAGAPWIGAFAAIGAILLYLFGKRRSK